ncbi:hypothetical protein RclHR1_11680002 [Rhizophagus clarus]|uniref:Uncharacterized protein n=1 Tax=Rhizophagus clarus TaxID=94130 RepID=A0A2Z6Q511_9GLOM|nr:hypothetical protein RclHR1_11680002 [Rhizophagus clarus]GES73925.1 hypothetical protein GLOIN_2v1473489 [Rhizophagus clarus]
MIQQFNISISQVLHMNECIKFFHYTLDDDNFYHITCHTLSQDSVFSDDHNYDHGFFYYDSEIDYYIECKLFSHPLIINILNKEIYGIDNEINNLDEKKSLTLNQKLNLERDLKQILPFHFMKNHILKRKLRPSPNKNVNPFHGHNIEQVSLTDGQNNFDNQSGFYQNRDVNYTYDMAHQQQQIDFNNMTSTRASLNEVGGYIHNVIPQQQTNLLNMSSAEREMRSGYKCTTNLSHGDNIMTTQMTSMINIQNGCLPHQNRAEDNQQAFDKFPQHQVSGREMRPDYGINTSSSQDNVATYDVSTTDINHDYHVDYTRNTYSQQQIDLNSLPQNHTPEGKNYMITTQSIPTVDINRDYCNENSMPYRCEY